MGRVGLAWYLHVQGVGATNVAILTLFKCTEPPFPDSLLHSAHTENLRWLIWEQFPSHDTSYLATSVAVNEGGSLE